MTVGAGAFDLRVSPATIVLGLLLAATLLVAPAEGRGLVATIDITVAIAWWYFESLRRNGEPSPVGDVGAWYALLVALYALIPVLIYLALGMRYTPLNDNRAYQLQPLPGTMARIAWMHNVHLLAFCVANRLVRRPVRPEQAERTIIPSGILGISVVGLVFTFLVIAFLMRGVSAGSYAEGYAAVAALPLAVRQMLKMVQGMDHVLTLLLIVALFRHYDRTKWIIWGYVAFRAFATTRAVGSRTDLAILMVTCVVLYHTTVRPISRRLAVIGLVAGLSAFMALGVLRAYQAMLTGDFAFGVSGGEFESVFVNALDLDARKQAGELGPIPFSMEVADVVAPIPSQFLPFQKVDLAEWYLSRFYPDVAEAGGGFAFGLVPQSIIGFGWAELLFRGALLGWLFGKLYALYLARRRSFWITVFYFWVLVWSYQTFRNSTFALLPFIVQWFLPTALAVEALRIFLVTGFSRVVPPVAVTPPPRSVR